MANKYFEITTSDNSRPQHPEDNTVILKAENLKNAMELFYENRGKMLVNGEAIKCRQVFYVIEIDIK